MQDNPNNTNVMYKAIFDEAIDSIITINKRGIIQTINDSTTKLFQFEQSELIGKNISILMPEPHKTAHDSYLDNHLKTGVKKIIGIGREVKGRKKDGTIFPIYLKVSKVEIDGAVSFVGIIHDISAMYEKINSEHKMIRERELNQAKSRMISTASHEFKTPLATIKSSASLIEKYLAIQDGNKILQHCAKIQKSSNQINHLINDLTNLNKIELLERNVTLKTVNLIPLTKQVIEECFPLKKVTQKIKFQASEKFIFFKTNYKLLSTVLTNLVTNACKYSRVDSIINVIIKQNPNDIQILVSDNGYGIAKEEVDFIFEPFFRCKNADNESGTGLGLSIVKQYIDFLNITIDVQSEVGNGTEFTLTLKGK